MSDSEKNGAATETAAPVVNEWTAAATLAVRNIDSVRVSPDGKHVVYVVTEPLMRDDKSEFISQIWLGNTDGSDTFPLTFADTSSRNPQWSTDGKYIAFTSKRGEKVNLFRIRLAGGEAEPILSGQKSDVGDFRWSPDGSHLAFTMGDPKTEQEEKDEKGKSDWRYEDEDIKFSRLYTVALEKGSDGKREPRKLTAKDYQVTDFEWSPDGTTIAFTHQPHPKADYWLDADISLVEVASGETRELVTGVAAAAQPHFSPDGTTLAFTLSDVPPTWAGSASLYTIPVAGGDPTQVLMTFQESMGLIGWSADGQQFYYSEPHHTSTLVHSVEVASGKVTNIVPSGGVSVGFRLNSTRTHFGFTRQTSEIPVEAFVSPVNAFSPVQVSKANADIPTYPLGKTEVIRWKSADGLEIEGLLTYPTNYVAGTPVPLLLEVHGGPAGYFVESFLGGLAIYPRAALAANGFAVLRSNPRGSTGYGAAFRHANYKDWGGGDYQDLMAGVDYVIAQGIADPEKLGVMGWSYGGFMTSWIISQTHRFKAASIGAAVTNLLSFTGTADIPAFLPDYFGAQPWEDTEIYVKHSPLLQMKGATTPSLIQHCVGDLRVPISQGFEVYNVLRQQNVPTRMLVVPRQTHSPMEPKAWLKVMETNIEWFVKYLIEG